MAVHFSITEWSILAKYKNVIKCWQPATKFTQRERNSVQSTPYQEQVSDITLPHLYYKYKSYNTVYMGVCVCVHKGALLTRVTGYYATTVLIWIFFRRLRDRYKPRSTRYTRIYWFEFCHVNFILDLIPGYLQLR